MKMLQLSDAVQATVVIAGMLLATVIFLFFIGKGCNEDMQDSRTKRNRSDILRVENECKQELLYIKGRLDERGKQ